MSQEEVPLNSKVVVETQELPADKPGPTLAKKAIAELIGTFLLTFAILASVQNVTAIGNNDFFQICVTHGLVLGVVAFIYGPVSGGHVNPAVSLAFLLKKAISAVEFAIYVAAQLVGSFLAAAAVSGLFHVNFTNCVDSCCGLCNEPIDGLHLASAFFTEVIGTFILIIAVLETANANNSMLSAPLAKVAVIFFAIILAGTTVGKLTGFAINPARDFAPRSWAAIVYGAGAFTTFTWVPVVGPMVGAAVAVAVSSLHQ